MSGSRSAVSSVDELEQAGPVVPPRPSKRPVVRGRASLIEIGANCNGKASIITRRSTQNGPETRRTVSSTQSRQAETKPEPQANGDHEKQLARMKARADRTAALKVELRKVKAEKEQLQAECASKAKRAAGLETRVTEMASRLLSADKKNKHLEGKAGQADQVNAKLIRATQQIGELTETTVPVLEKKNQELEAKLKVSSRDSTSSTADAKQLAEENKTLREKLKIATAELEAVALSADYEEELERANNNINIQYATVVSEYAAKESQIAELQTQLSTLQGNYDHLKLISSSNTSALESQLKSLQRDLIKANAERDQVEYNALNSLGKYSHLKQEPVLIPRLDLVLFRGVHTTPIASPEPRLSTNPHVNVSSKPSAPIPTHTAASNLPKPAGSTSLQPLPANPPVAPTKPVMPETTAQATPTLPDIHVTVNIKAEDRKNMNLFKRMQAALTKNSTIDFYGPPEVVTEIRKTAEELQIDHAAQRAKVVELRAFLQGQAREIETLKAKNVQDVHQLKGRHCLIPEHRYLADHVAAMQDRVDMQVMLLACAEGPERRKEVRSDEAPA
ncbi:hypothetical protein K458DRAFT_405988 [Lentithecium fluviatile CBS 122367]|uniref:Uncharacterized protein n=1 Tax=Lentithecium fluviatile CBS 122367 TaxID=1168545 RepID=A0A6G1IW93_9PLEO|nr:hypothetical protein K458DRAFT_405988 [Lentithecium fluviatile CBS 122367]